MRTYFPKQGDIEPRWFIIDAENKILGRLSTEIARIITGKNKPTYTPFLDTGDHVIIINAEKVLLTGRKETDKVYRSHSLYPGGLKSREARFVRAEKPESDDRRSGLGHAAEEQARPEDAQEAEGLSRHRSPPRGSEAREARAREVTTGGFPWLWLNTTVPDGARLPRRAFTFVPAAVRSRSTDRGLDEYFGNDVLKMIIKQPFSLTETVDKFDIVVTVDGGGPSGQAGAIRHGISRALQVYNMELRKRLKKAGLLTRDPRMKERKKYGQKGARARFQFSKR